MREGTSAEESRKRNYMEKKKEKMREGQCGDEVQRI